MDFTGESLVNLLAECANIDTSVARRAVVEGRVSVNGAVKDNPDARLHTEEPSFIGYSGALYPYYPGTYARNKALLAELLAMRELDIKVSDNTLNHARTEDLSQYESMSVGDLASLFCELYNGGGTHD